MLARTSAKARGFLPRLFSKNPNKGASKPTTSANGSGGEEADDEDDYGASLKEFYRGNSQQRRKDKKTIFLEKLLKGIEIGAIGAVGSLIGAKLVLGASPRAQRFIINQLSDRYIKKHFPNFEFMYGEVHYNPIFNRITFKNGSIMIKTPNRIPKTFNYTAVIHFERIDFTFPLILSLISKISSNLFEGIYIKGADVFLDLRNIHRPLPTLSQQLQYYHSQKNHHIGGDNVRSSASSATSSSSSSTSSSSTSSSSSSSGGSASSSTTSRLNSTSGSDSNSSDPDSDPDSDSLNDSDDDGNGSDNDNRVGLLKRFMIGKIKNVKIEDSHAIILTKNQKKKGQIILNIRNFECPRINPNNLLFDLLHTKSLDCQLNDSRITLVRHRGRFMGLKNNPFSELRIQNLDATFLRENIKFPVISWFADGKISFTSKYRFEYKSSGFYTEPGIDSHNTISFRDIHLKKPCLLEKPIPVVYNLLAPILIKYYNKNNRLKLGFSVSAKNVKNEYLRNFGQVFLKSYVNSLPSKWTLVNSFIFG